MKLYIDSREPKKIINYITALCDDKFTIEIKQLDLGDYIIYDNINNKTLVIFERKSLNDLEASIKDGRYEEQGFRLNSHELHNHNIYYLIEGSIINYKNTNFKQSLYSSIASISFYKGFSIINSLNDIESCEIIVNFTKKLVRENKKRGYYLEDSVDKNCKISYEISGNNIIEKEEKEEEKEETYQDNIKLKKNSFITRENINNIMLMQIPGISSASATIIMEKFENIENLIKCLRYDMNCLDDLKTKNNRKLGKNVIINIKKYLM